MKTMSRKLLRSVITVAGVALLTLAFVCAYWLISIRGEARSAPFLSRYVEFKLGGILHDCDIHIGGSDIAWLNKEKKFVINHYKLEVAHENKPVSLQLPRLTYEISYSNLLPFALSKVTANLYDLTASYKFILVENPKQKRAPVVVNQQLRGEELSPDNPEAGPKAEVAGEVANLDDKREGAYLAALDNFLRPVFERLSEMDSEFVLNLNADDTVIHITRGSKEEKFFIPQATAGFASNAEKIKFEAKLHGMEAGHNIVMTGGFQYIHGSEKLNTDMRLENLPTSILSPFMFEDDSYVDLVLNGQAKLSAHREEDKDRLVIDVFKLDITNSNGSVKLAQLGMKPWHLDDVQISMTHDSANRRVAIPVIAARLQKVANISGNGFWYFANPLYLAKFNLGVDHIPYSDLIELWPNDIVPPVKSWMKEHFSGGEVKDIKANFVIDHEYRLKFPADQVLAKLNLQGAQLRYLERFPEVKDLNASANFYPKKVDITIAEGRSGGSKVFGTVTIPYRKGGEVKIKLNTKGIIRDLLEFNKDSVPQIEKLLPLSALQGEADSDIEISFPIKDELEFDDVEIIVAANATGVSGVLRGSEGTGGVNFRNGSIKGKFNSGVIEISGLCEVWKQPVHLEMRIPLEVGLEYMQLKTTLTANNPHLEGYILEGDLPLTLTAKLDDNESYKFQLEAEPSKQSLSIPEILFTKDADIPLQFNVVGVAYPGKQVKVDNLTLVAGSQRILGEMDYDIPEGAFTVVDLPEFKTGKQDLAIKGSIRPKVSEWSISGNKLSLSPALIALFKQEKQAAKRKVAKGERSFDLTVDELTLVGGEIVRAPRLSYHCDDLRCRYVNVDIKTDDGDYLHLSIDPKASPPFLLAGENVGSVLQGLGAGTTLKGGKVDAKGDFSSGRSGSMSGEFVLTDFALTSNSLLARLLSLTTIPGIVSLSKDLEFEKVKGQFAWENKELQLDKVRSYGKKLGITATGFVNFASEEMVLKGELYPALYGFNYALKNIPLIGALLTGQGNTGVFAAGYRIGGSFDNPSYSVNPFSLIKPGILRDIF